MENLEFIGKDNVTFVSKGSTHIWIPLNYLKVLSYLKKLMTKIDQEEDCMFNLVTVSQKEYLKIGWIRTCINQRHGWKQEGHW